MVLCAINCLICLCAGCKSQSKQQQDVFDPSKRSVVISSEQLNSEVLNFADNFIARVSEACDQVEQKYGADNPKLRARMTATKIGQTLAAIDIATGPNPEINLFDMAVMITLKKQAIEDYDIPRELDGKGGEFLIPMYQKNYDEIWALTSRILNEQQLKELRSLIEQWRRDNPNQAYVGFVRLQDFASFRMAQQAPQQIKAGSLFSLLYVDPLAGLDPVAQQMARFRDLTARLSFVVQRMPLIVQWQFHREMDVALSNDRLARFVQSTTKFSDTADRFTTAIVKYPNQFKTDSQAMVVKLREALAASIDQANERIAAQREAMMTGLDDKTSRLGQLVDKVSATVDGTKQTITTTKDAGKDILFTAFYLAAALIVLIPTVLLGYRAAARRLGLAARA